LHAVIVVTILLTVIQMTLIYYKSDFKGVSPAKVSAIEFAKSQSSLASYSLLNMKQVFV
jgi:uncharacterized protein YpmB